MSTELKRYEDKDILVIDEIPPFSIEDYDLLDDKDFKKYVSDGEKIIRKSFEYGEFISFLRNYMDMNKCSFFENVNNIDTYKIKIHIHHCPFTLYDLFLTIFNKRSFYHESLEIEMVAKETMYIHYFLMVGLIPLAETVHELVHSQVIFIPINKVCGNYNLFINTYNTFIPDEAMERFEALKQQSKVYNEAANLDILREQPLVIQIPHEYGLGSYNLPSMQQVLELVENKVHEIKYKQQAQIDEYNDGRYDNIVTSDDNEGFIRPMILQPLIVPMYINHNI